MNITTTPALRQHPKLVSVVTAAEPVVRDEITSVTANGEWDFAVDERSRPLVELKVTDSFDGQASARFAPAELEIESHFRERVRDLHGALLRVGDWRHNRLPALYHHMRQWTAALQSPCFIQDTIVAVNERLSGPYEAAGLDIARGNRLVHVKPVAIWIVGGSGRVDVEGPSDRFILVLNDGEWHIVDPGDVVSKPKRLTQATYTDLLEWLLT